MAFLSFPLLCSSIRCLRLWTLDNYRNLGEITILLYLPRKFSMEQGSMHALARMRHLSMTAYPDTMFG